MTFTKYYWSCVDFTGLADHQSSLEVSGGSEIEMIVLFILLADAFVACPLNAVFGIIPDWILYTIKISKLSDTSLCGMKDKE